MLKTILGGICVAILVLTAGSVGRLSNDIEIRNPMTIAKKNEITLHIPRRIVVIAGERPVLLKSVTQGSKVIWHSNDPACYFDYVNDHDIHVGASKPGKYVIWAATVANGNLTSPQECEVWAMQSGPVSLPGAKADEEQIPATKPKTQPPAPAPVPVDESPAIPKEKRLYLEIVYGKDQIKPAAFDSVSAKTLLSAYNVEVVREDSSEVVDAGLVPYIKGKTFPMLLIVKPGEGNEEADVLYAERLPGSVEEVARIARKYQK